MNIVAHILTLSLILFCSYTNLAAQESETSVHGSEWAFGHSGAREDEIWKNGVSGKTITKRAMPNSDTATDTSAGIDRALRSVEKPKSRLGMSMTNESGSWKVAPEEKKLHPDENMYRDRRNVVRAFADVKPTEDLSISVGPELILKDERHGSETANENQPDSEIGVGMKFKYDF